MLNVASEEPSPISVIENRLVLTWTISVIALSSLITAMTLMRWPLIWQDQVHIAEWAFLVLNPDTPYALGMHADGSAQVSFYPNSLLLRSIYYEVFGFSHLTVRLAGLLGAVMLFITSFLYFRSKLPSLAYASLLALCITYSPRIFQAFHSSRLDATAMAAIFTSLLLLERALVDKQWFLYFFSGIALGFATSSWPTSIVPGSIIILFTLLGHTRDYKQWCLAIVSGLCGLCVYVLLSLGLLYLWIGHEAFTQLLHQKSGLESANAPWTLEWIKQVVVRNYIVFVIMTPSVIGFLVCVLMHFKSAKACVAVMAVLLTLIILTILRPHPHRLVYMVPVLYWGISLLGSDKVIYRYGLILMSVLIVSISVGLSSFDTLRTWKDRDPQIPDEVVESLPQPGLIYGDWSLFFATRKHDHPLIVLFMQAPSAEQVDQVTYIIVPEEFPHWAEPADFKLLYTVDHSFKRYKIGRTYGYRYRVYMRKAHEIKDPPQAPAESYSH